MEKKSEETQIDLPEDGRWKKSIVMYEVRTESSPHIDYLKQKQANLQYVKQSTLIRLMSE